MSQQMKSPFIDAFANRRVITLTALGFSSGLPLLLTGGTLAAWMTNVGVSLSTIGLLALAHLPYSLKFLWAPLLDRYSLPWLGRRRDWLLLTQIALLFGITALGMINPSASTPIAIAMATLISVIAATQDIVADAYRTDILPQAERAAGTATFVFGYRIALLMSGALALVLSETLPWRLVYWLMAGLMLVGIGATLAAPAPPECGRQPLTLQDAVMHPFVDYFRKPGAILALMVIFFYKFGDAIASTMITPFFIKTGFTNAEIGLLNKGLGFAATILGAFLGGGLVAHLGIRRALFLFGALQAATNTVYALLAVVGRNYALLIIGIAADQLCGGMATTAYIAFLMTLCSRQHSATQYALLSSLSSLGARILGAAAGYLVEATSWASFFVVTIVLATPALVLLSRLPESLFVDKKESLAKADQDEH